MKVISMKKMFLVVAMILIPYIALADHNPEHDQFEQDGFFSIEVKPDIHMISDGAVNCVLIVTKHSAVLIDAPPAIGSSQSKTIVDAITSITDHPVDRIIYTHSHSDHIGAAGLVVSWMQENFPGRSVRIYAHKNAKQKLLDENASARPLPTKTFSKKRTLKLSSTDNSNLKISLVYLGTNHSDDNIFIHLPAEDLLIWVDVVNPGGIPFGIQFAQSLTGHLRSHEQALEFSFETHIPGHLGVGNRQFIKDSRVFLADLADKSLNALFAALSTINIRFSYPFDNPDLITQLYEDFAEDVFARAAEICVDFMTDASNGGNASLETGIWQLTTPDDVTFGPLGGVTPATILNDCGAMTINLITLGFPSLAGVGGGVAETVERLEDL